MRKSTVIALAVCALVVLGQRVASAGVTFDWSTWQRLPVWDDGRVKPLDTLAREIVPKITNREYPRLKLKGAVPDKDFESDALAGARSLFPDDAERKFSPSEMVFSWIVEHEKWEHVPFLLAEHKDVRELLGVPPRNDQGEWLRYVSPAQIEAADEYHKKMDELEERSRDARQAERKFEPNPFERKLIELRNAFNLFRRLSFDKVLDRDARMAIRGPLEGVAEDWTAVEGLVATIPDSEQEPGASIARLKRAYYGAKPAEGSKEKPYAGFAAILGRQGALDRQEATAAVEELALAADHARSEFEKLRERLTRSGANQDLDAERAKTLEKNLSQFAFGFRRLAQSSMGLMAAMDGAAESIRVVPALVPEALAKRRTRDGAPVQPWLDLQVILSGSPRILAAQGYPTEQMEQARNRFNEVLSAYDAGEREKFAASMERFDIALGDLALAIEPERAKYLDDMKLSEGLDREVLALTERPAVGSRAAERINAEVRYHKVDPFKWAWIVALASFICYALAFGVLRKPMFWVGTAVLALSLLISVYGFYLRVFVSSWAPVTNMYETVVYVPFVVGCLGLWFLLLPVTWDGLRLGWNLTAIPFSWEAGPAPETKSGEKSGWLWGAGELPPVQVLLLLPRIALSVGLFWILSIAPYAAGGRTIINLLPRLDVGSEMPNATSVSVWLVGMAMLIPCVWYVPRVLLALLAAPITIPWTVMNDSRDRLEPVYERQSFGMGSAFVAFFLCCVAWFASGPSESAPILNAKFAPLNPVLRDNFWLTIHVLTIVSSYGAGFLAWILGVVSLFHYIGGRYRSPIPVAEPADDRLRPAGPAPEEAPLARRPPEECTTLASYTYKAMQVAVLLLITGTILGGLWADVSWGRFWGWDAKEVWALISGLCYLAILHGRYAGWFGNFGTALGGVIGFSSIMFSWYGVNFILPLFSSTGEVGLHSYGSGSGGQGYVLGFVLVSWAIAGVAAVRYLSETSTPASHA